MKILYNANKLYDDIFTIIISIYINHIHKVYTNPAILNYHVNKTRIWNIKLILNIWLIVYLYTFFSI